MHIQSFPIGSSLDFEEVLVMTYSGKVLLVHVLLRALYISFFSLASRPVIWIPLSGTVAPLQPERLVWEGRNCTKRDSTHCCGAFVCAGPSWSSTTSESTVAAVTEACRQLVANLEPWRQVSADLASLLLPVLKFQPSDGLICKAVFHCHKGLLG